MQASSKDVVSKIALYAKDASVIVVTNPLDPMTYFMLKTSWSKKEQGYGNGWHARLIKVPELYSEMRQIFQRSSIQGIMVISEHGENVLPADKVLFNRRNTASGVYLKG